MEQTLEAQRRETKPERPLRPSLRLGEAVPTRARLPLAVAALASRCGAKLSDGSRDQVVLTQVGAMREAGGSWKPFNALQSMVVERPEFSWRARTGPFGGIRITDALNRDGGRLTVTAFGLVPLIRAPRDDALTKGELQRYLAELPLAPDAILRNTSLVWEELSSTCLRVAATVGHVSAHVDLTLGANGLVASAFAPDRPRLNGSEQPWRGCFSDYRRYDGRQLPFAAEASWTTSGEPSAYWRGSMLTWGLYPE